MPIPPLNQSQLVASFPDNTIGEITAQNMRDFADSTLLIVNNLSDVPSTATARTNLGLGTAATHAATDFDTAGSAASAAAAALQKSANLSDVANAPTARTNLGLGSAATHAATDFDPSGSASSKLPLSGGSMLGTLMMNGSGFFLGNGTDGSGAAMYLEGAQIVDSGNVTIYSMGVFTGTAFNGGAFAGDGSALINLAPSHIAGFPENPSLYLDGGGNWSSPAAGDAAGGTIVNLYQLGGFTNGSIDVLNITSQMSMGGNTLDMAGGAVINARYFQSTATDGVVFAANSGSLPFLVCNSGSRALWAEVLNITGALADGTYPTAGGAGSITITNGVITAIS
jgi:hypothetical protein